MSGLNPNTSDWPLQEGSEIFISEEDTEARLKEAAAARKAQAEQLAQRMLQQLQVRSYTLRGTTGFGMES